jgi:regulator of sigma E protease
MEGTAPSSTTQKLLYALAGIAGISLVILIHEAGHFVFAHLFNVPTPVFSIGFGPALYKTSFGETIFKITFFPIGGYVELDSELLAQSSYLAKMLIIFGGILFNIAFAYAILLYYTIRNKLSPSAQFSSSQAIKQTFTTIFTQQNGNTTFVGPIGIIRMIGQSIAINTQLYWFALAIISFNIALLNMIPLPFFDGGKALIYTIEVLCGCTISPSIVWIISVISLAMFMAFIMQLTMNDIRRLVKR